ncbi:hypothetical protein [Eleftheria terrae]|uniref:hypothetical protein n=1 Tax=Eleftheria terrae TaxID=1597781 RepID=UPI00263BB4B8|nr:hypothetical protein [Eleftheria terrae]WKB50568.1 hypothetical protein N7L95_00170 [Eleftheria terrae]
MAVEDQQKVALTTLGLAVFVWGLTVSTGADAVPIRFLGWLIAGVGMLVATVAVFWPGERTAKLKRVRVSCDGLSVLGEVNAGTSLICGRYARMRFYTVHGTSLWGPGSDGWVTVLVKRVGEVSVRPDCRAAYPNFAERVRAQQ